MKIAAAILIENHKILICQRAGLGSCANLWEFPGGKLEPGETLQECALRECKEELGITLKIGELFAESVYHYPDREVEITFFLAKRVSGEPRQKVHQALCWASPTELPCYPFCPADEDVVTKLSHMDI